MAKKSELPKVDLTSYDDLFGISKDSGQESAEQVVHLPLSEIHPYRNHPYKIIESSPDMIRLFESIQNRGVDNPSIVRPDTNGGYEIISGHRRHWCSKVADLPTLPCIVRNIDDDTADIMVVDANIYREDLLPSEKAKAYKIRLDAMKRQGIRTDLTSGQVVQKLQAKTSVEELSALVDENYKQIQRYIRLNELIPELLEMVDKKKIKFNPAVEISHLSDKEQKQLMHVIEVDELLPSLKQAQKLKQFSQEDKLHENDIAAIMSEEKPLEVKVVFSEDKIKKYFPKSYTAKQMEETIIKLLDSWNRKRQVEKDR